MAPQAQLALYKSARKAVPVSHGMICRASRLLLRILSFCCAGSPVDPVQ